MSDALFPRLRWALRLQTTLAPIDSPSQQEMGFLLAGPQGASYGEVDLSFPFAKIEELASEPLESSASEDLGLWAARPKVGSIRLQEIPTSDVRSIDFSLATEVDLYEVAWGPFAEVEIFDALSAIADMPQVSDDLFRPLVVSGVGGSKYGRKRDLYSDETDYSPSSTNRTKDGLRQSFSIRSQSRSRTAVDTLSFWERLLPLLEPPISFAFPPELFLPYPLYPYQCEGVRFLAANLSALLADEMGTGKTIQTIVALRLLFQVGEVKSALVVAPVSLLANWDRELERWAPSLGVTVVRGALDLRRSQWRRPAHIWITSYGVIRSDIDEIVENKEFDVVVLDEIQAIKNAGSAQSVAAKRIPRAWAWGLSGTPVENQLEDLVSILDFLKPDLLVEGKPTADEAAAALRPFFLRRRKADVLEQLPEKKQFPRWVTLEDCQRRAYERAEQEGVVYLQSLGREVTVVHVLELLGRLKMLCNRDPESEESAKLDALKEDLRDVVESGSKALVFSQFRAEGVDFLQEALSEYSPAVVVGGQSMRARDGEVRRYQADPACKVLIATPRAGGVGLNLVSGNYVFHFDHWWNPATVQQAEDRAHRIGQTKDVFVYHLWAVGTVEERIEKILAAKRSLFKAVIDDMSTEDEAGLSESELFGLFGLDSQVGTMGSRTLGASAGEWTPERVMALSPREFEEFVGRLYEASGFHVRLTPESNDGGIDLAATRGRAGEGVEKYAVQCKRYAKTSIVGVDEARALLGVLSRFPEFTKGVLVTTSEFSQACRTFCEGLGRIELVSGPRLLEWARQAFSPGESSS